MAGVERLRTRDPALRGDEEALIRAINRLMEQRDARIAALEEEVETLKARLLAAGIP